MKIIVNSLDLSDAVAKVSKALSGKDAAPVLECIKFAAENDKLTLYATDRDLAIEKTIDANVIIGGTMLVPGKIFADYIRNIADTDMDVSLDTVDDNRLYVSTASSECNIATLDVDEYPDVEEVGGNSYFAITERSLKETINNVLFSVAVDDSRAMLKGVYLDGSEYTLTAVATDGYRFAMSKKALEEPVEHLSATVPSRSMSELFKLLGDSDNVLKVCIENNYMMVAMENTRLFTRLLAGQYIKYDNIVPREFVSTLTVDKSTFERSLNTASIMSRAEKNNLVQFDIEEYTMTISSTSQYGTAKESVPVSLCGKDINSTYNSRYLNDCLRVINADTIKMEFAKHNGCVITVNNSDEVLYFILPVKTIG